MLKAFLLVLLLASGLRFTALTFDSLWLDESYQTVVESYGNNLPDLLNSSSKAFLYKSDNPASPEDVLKNFRRVDPLCPPLFAVMMNRWLTTLGGSDFSMRAFSALCSVLAIMGIYFFGSVLLGKNIGLCAALVQTISPFDISYAQEARMYSLCTLLAVISGGSFLYLCIKKYSLKHWFFAGLYIISTWALINAHYTQIFLWASTFIITLAVAISRKNSRLFVIMAVATLCIIALSLPWAPLFVQAAKIRTASFYVSRHPTLWWPVWALLVRVPFNWLTFLAGKKVVFWAIPVYLTSLTILGKSFISLVNHIKKISSKKYSKLLVARLTLNYPLTLLCLWATLPALMIWILDVLESHRVVEISRYLISTAPAVYLLAGYGLFSLSSKQYQRYFYLIAFGHALFCLTNNAYSHIVPQKENWRQIASVIEEKCHPDEILFVSNYYNIVCLDRYLRRPLRQMGISPIIGDKVINSTIIKEQNATRSQPTFWILAAQEGDAVFNTIPARFKIVQSYDFPHALHLRQYQTQQD